MQIKSLAGLVLMCGFSANVLAANPACERKAAQITQQIHEANANDNRARAQGLETALMNVLAKCTDAELIAEKKEDIADQQEDIDELLAEIKEKQSENKPDKVAKLEGKLKTEREELDVLRRELAEIESP
ncbi:MAG TPA: DUF1090 domain-containing protein [Pusillimonas sp.]|nr:DUF1090 domain-containing protein [Pusillimonas sp.]|tara:strand:+ start:420 stop:809 length:390 start_codon:yes stop_codon:yes gene_type:complete